MSGPIPMPDPQEPVFVLSLLLSDVQRPDELVLGVRRPTAHAQRHPGVVSTPTQRLPAPLFRACQAWWPELDHDPGTEPAPIVIGLVDEGEAPVGGPDAAAVPLSYAVETLMCRKLALTHALASGEVWGIATPVAVAAADVDDPKGTGRSEATVMLTTRVLLNGLDATLPTSTRYLDPLIFSEATAFVQAVEQNDALLLDPSFDPFEICIGGLCVASGAAVIQQSAG
jgi:hypothetical protein